MNEEQFKRFEKTLFASKKFVAFLLTLIVLSGLGVFLIWKIADAGDIGMWTSMLLITDIVALSIVSLANNVSQAKLDSVVRLASILGDKFPVDAFKKLTGQ